MHIEFTLTLDDYREANVAVIRTKLKVRFSWLMRDAMFFLSGSIGVVMGLQGINVAIRWHTTHAGLWWNALLVAVGVYLVISAFIGRSRAVRRAWNAQPVLQLRRRVDFGDDMVVLDDTQTRTEYKWSAFVRYVESAKLFTLLPSEMHLLIIPKRSLGAEAQVVEFRRLLDERVARPAVPGFPVTTAQAKHG